MEEGLLADGGVLQIGIRGPYSAPNDLEFSRKHGFEILEVDAVKRDFGSGTDAGDGAEEPSISSEDPHFAQKLFSDGLSCPQVGQLSASEVPQFPQN